MSNEIKVTEVWCKPEEDGSPNYLDTSRSFVEGDRRVVLVWKDDYDAMRKELEEWRQFKAKNKAMWQGAVKLIAEEHD